MHVLAVLVGIGALVGGFGFLSEALSENWLPFCVVTGVYFLVWGVSKAFIFQNLSALRALGAYVAIVGVIFMFMLLADGRTLSAWLVGTIFCVVSASLFDGGKSAK